MKKILLVIIIAILFPSVAPAKDLMLEKTLIAEAADSHIVLDAQIASDGDIVYILWKMSDGLYFTRSLDRGSSFESARKILDADMDADPPVFLGAVSIAVSSVGGIYIFYDIDRGERNSIEMLRSFDNGEQFDQKTIFPSDDVPALNSFGFLMGADLKIVDNTIYYAFCTQGVHLLISDNGGENFKLLPVSVGPSNSPEDYSEWPVISDSPGVGIDQLGNVYVAWYGSDLGKDVEDTKNLSVDVYLSIKYHDQDKFGPPVMIQAADGMGSGFSPIFLTTPNGTVHLFWDTPPRYDPEIPNTLMTHVPQYYIYTSDNGLTFSEKVQVRMDISDPENSSNVNVQALFATEDAVHFVYGYGGMVGQSLVEAGLRYVVSNDMQSLLTVGESDTIGEEYIFPDFEVKDNQILMIAVGSSSPKDHFDQLYFLKSLPASASNSPDISNNESGDDSGGGGCFVNTLLLTSIFAQF